ncbi:hypothetical protein ES708_08571 [subsurface metagenome]
MGAIGDINILDGQRIKNFNGGCPADSVGQVVVAGEEKNDKGFYVVNIQDDKETSKREVSFDFHPVIGRRFLTINTTIEPQDTSPTLTVLKTITEQENKITDAVIRLQIILPAQLEGQLKDNEIRDALKEAHYFTIAKDIRRESRLRLGGELTAEEIAPIDALKKWLEVKKVSPERAKTLLEYGEKLIQGQRTE